MTDDQRADDIGPMTKTRRLLGDAGVTFDRSYVNYPLCCPSRATFLTGQYAHNHGVRFNFSPIGGFYQSSSTRSNTLPVWLRRAGYSTHLLGKYLNEYGERNPREIPPGWTDWFGMVDPSTYGYFGYKVNDNGRVRTYGKAAEGLPDRRAREPGRQGHPRRQEPPRSPSSCGSRRRRRTRSPSRSTAAPRARRPSRLRGTPSVFANAPIRRLPSFDEADVRRQAGAAPHRLRQPADRAADRQPDRALPRPAWARCWRRRRGRRRSSAQLRRTGQLDNTVLDLHLRQRLDHRRAPALPEPQARQLDRREVLRVRGGHPRPADHPGPRASAAPATSPRP